MNRFSLPCLGFGAGLRTQHFGHLLEQTPPVGFFEIISENFIDSGGRPRYVLDRIAERYPIVMHGVSLSIGSADPLDVDYLRRLKRLADDIGARWISDHLCWTGIGGHNAHDLLPLPLNEETLGYTVERIRMVQDILERPLILENPSSYLQLEPSTMPEWEFLARMAEEADCGLLLDVNNIYVSAFNHGFDPLAFLSAIPADRVVQMHLAGHTHHGRYIIDSHIGPIIDAVWSLYQLAWERCGETSVLIEWDEEVPEWPVLEAEVSKAAAMVAAVSAR